jgi:hypothetical protein
MVMPFDVSHGFCCLRLLQVFLPHLRTLHPRHNHHQQQQRQQQHLICRFQSHLQQRTGYYQKQQQQQPTQVVSRCH